MPTATILSFRLGGYDGVSIEAAKWAWALHQLGWRTVTVAGAGPVDHLLPGLAMDATEPPGAPELDLALDGSDLTVVENLCSLPLNPGAAEVVAERLAGRPAILHHHDLAFQREQFADLPPPDDPAWRHVTINDLSRRQLAERGVEARTIHNTFDTAAAPGRRTELRRALGLAEEQRVVLQPTRAIPRKGIATGIALAEALGALYWLLGPPEDGFGPELASLLSGARCPVLHGWDGITWATMADAYAACDLVAMPSSWEGFGNPTVESAVHRRPLAVAPYPVARELESFGFCWFPVDPPDEAAAWLERPEPMLLDHNFQVARRHFSLADLPARLRPVLDSLGVTPR